MKLLSKICGLTGPPALVMRLSVAGAAKDAQVQNDILLSDFTRNLVVVGRQPHPGPNFASEDLAS